MRPKAVFTGFDSAWTVGKQGAIAHVVVEDGECVLVEPEVANFAEALDSINTAGAGADLHVIAVDQPLIVPNETGSRPVEAAFRSMLGSLGGAIQPSSRSRVDMFGDSAPIWTFMADLDADEDAFAIPGASEGRFTFEAYPVAAQIGWRSRNQPLRPLLKYNPGNRNTFTMHSWVAMCELVRGEAARLGMREVSVWCEQSAGVLAPRKQDQDKLDAMICTLVAYEWWAHGLTNCALIGDHVSGYIVSPVSLVMAERLRLRIVQLELREPSVRVPFATAVH